MSSSHQSESCWFFFHNTSWSFPSFPAAATPAQTSSSDTWAICTNGALLHPDLDGLMSGLGTVLWSHCSLCRHLWWSSVFRMKVGCLNSAFQNLVPVLLSFSLSSFFFSLPSFLPSFQFLFKIFFYCVAKWPSLSHTHTRAHTHICSFSHIILHHAPS